MEWLEWHSTFMSQIVEDLQSTYNNAIVCAVLELHPAFK